MKQADKRKDREDKMAKNFGKAGSAKTITDVAKASATKAQVVVLKNIADEDLLDYAQNNEDVTELDDLIKSMQENGFTDPLEVTDFGMEAGKFTIVSGHRRRMAGREMGYENFPCIVRSFKNEVEVKNYVLFANSQRDSSKDPLLFCKRYKMHEEYLKEAGFTGKIREEVAKRLGISVPQADRYNSMNKIILSVWDMVREETVGMSSVLPLASHNPEEQEEIYKIMQEALKKGATLTRDTVKLIVDSFRNGKKTWAEIADLPRDSGLPLNMNINTDPTESREPKEHDRNDEVRHDFDPIAAEADKMDADRAAWEAEQEKADGDNGEKEPKHKLTDEEKQVKRGKDILKELEKLNASLSDIYTFEDDDEGEEAMLNMASTFSVIVDELYNISRDYNRTDLFTNLLKDLKEKVEEY